MDAIRQHLNLFLTNYSPDEVMEVVERDAYPGGSTTLSVHGQEVSFVPLGQSVSTGPGEVHDRLVPTEPWRFSADNVAEQFCDLVQEAYRSVGATCEVYGR